jgi:hypothetical protein
MEWISGFGQKLLNSLSGAVGNAKRWGVQLKLDDYRANARRAIDMLRQVAPQSRTLKKPAVMKLEAKAPPDPDASHGDSPPDRQPMPPQSPPDSPSDQTAIPPQSLQDRR